MGVVRRNGGVGERPKWMQVVIAELGIATDVSSVLASVFANIQNLSVLNENNNFALYVVTGSVR